MNNFPKLTIDQVRVLNRLQQDLPVNNNIFNKVAEDTSLKLKNTMQIIKELQELDVMSNISAVINKRKAGYRTILSAFKVKEKDLEKNISTIIDYPLVSKCYHIENEFNIWFKITLKEDIPYEKQIQTLAEESNVEKYILFDTKFKTHLRDYMAVRHNEISPKKIPVLDIEKNCGTHDSYLIPEQIRQSKISEKNTKPIIGDIYREFDAGLHMRSLESKDIKYLNLLQSPLPITENPFSKLIENEKSDIDVIDLGNHAIELKKTNVIIKYNAYIKHYLTGYNFSALTAWKINLDALNEIKQCLDNLSNISHFHIMDSTEESWKENLFLLVYASDENELKQTIDTIMSQAGLNTLKLLKIKNELKSRRIKFFN